MFRIGDFSRLAHVTIKTLHHYDEASLLQPVYHRYGADQVGYRLPASVLTNDSDEYVTELQAPVEGV